MKRVICVLGLAVQAVIVVNASDRYVVVEGGIKLFVRDIGTGSSIVVLHGGPGMDMNYLVDNLRPLARTHRVILYDQRGSGRSTLAENVMADQLVADLDALRQKLHLRRLTLLGHSWGGTLAALYAIAHPDRVERLVLADAMPVRLSGLKGYGDLLQSRLSDEDRARSRSAAAARRAAETPEQHVAACRAYWAIMAKAYFSDPAAAAKDKGDLCAAGGDALANGLAVNASVLASLGDYDLRPAAARLTMPALVIYGEDDPIGLENAREWAGTLPHARLVVVPNAGHMPYVEQPDAFFGAIEEFLRTGRTSPPQSASGRSNQATSQYLPNFLPTE